MPEIRIYLQGVTGIHATDYQAVGKHKNNFTAYRQAIFGWIILFRHLYENRYKPENSSAIIFRDICTVYADFGLNILL